MKNERGNSRIAPWVFITLYVCAGVIWLGAQAWVLDYFDVSTHQQSVRWQISLFIAWLLISSAVAARLIARKHRADQVRQETAQELELVVRYAPAGMARVHVGGAEISWANAKLAGWVAAWNPCAARTSERWCPLTTPQKWLCRSSACLTAV